MFSRLKGDAQSSSAGSSEKDPFASLLADPTLRLEFILLVLLVTNKLRDRLLSTFDVAQTSSSANSSFQKSPAPLLGDDEEAPPSYHAATSGRGRQDYDRRDEELSMPETRELRRAALASLNKWRTSVLRRLGEILNVRTEAVLREKERREREGNLLDLDDDSTSAIASHQGKEKKKGSHYTRLPNPFTRLDEEKRSALLSSLLLLLLSLETYSAYSRLLLCHICSSLDLPVSVLNAHEAQVAKGLLAASSAAAEKQQQQMSADQSTREAASANSSSRAWKVGLATVAGAALIGITGGLAAPLLAAGVGGIFGALGLGTTAAAGLLGGLAGNVVLIGGLFGAYGGRMTGKMMDRYAREIEDFAFVPLRQRAATSAHYTPSSRSSSTKADASQGIPQASSIASSDEQNGMSTSEHHRLRLAIAISGWATTLSDFYWPWLPISPTSLEPFALRWETSLLLELGTSLRTFLTSYIWDAAASEIASRTILATLAAGLWPLGLLRVCRLVDNPFSVAKARADKAGELLADALVQKVQGERPVQLVGYSLGARVIYAACQALARRRAFGLVESVVLMGAPVPSDAADWRAIRSVVVGRVLNAYCSNDYVLGFLYRTAAVQFGVAGLQPVEDVAGVESFDVSGIVGGHLRYKDVTGRILQAVGFEEVTADAVEKQESEVRAREEKERRDAELKKLAQEKKKVEARAGQEMGLIELDEGDEHRSAQPLSEKDIEQRVQRLRLEDEKEDAEGLPPVLPPRREKRVPQNTSISEEPPLSTNDQRPALPARPSNFSHSILKQQQQQQAEHYDSSDDADNQEERHFHGRIQMLDTETETSASASADAEAEAETRALEAEVAKSVQREKTKAQTQEGRGGGMMVLEPEPMLDDE